MVGAGVALPVPREEVDIEIPVGDGTRPAGNHLHRAVAKRDRRKPRRTRETLLGAAIQRVDPPRINLHGHPAEARDRVDDVERAVFLHQRSDLFYGIGDTG